MVSTVGGSHAVLLGTLVAGGIIGLYHYLRIIVAMAAPALVLLLISLGTGPAPLLTLDPHRPPMVALIPAVVARRRRKLAKISRFAVT